MAAAHLTRRIRLWALLVWAMGLLFVAGDIRGEDAAADSAAYFEQHIRPVLVEHCYKCHSRQAEKLKGGLRADTADGLRRGGHSGPAVVPGEPDQSLLILAIRQTDADLQMPPKKKLPAEVIARFERWVSSGAPDPRIEEPGGEKPHEPSHLDFEAAKRHWAFTPIGSPQPPREGEAGRNRNPIDLFIEAVQRQRGVTPLALAERRALIRRATFDLTGLPPTPREVAAFIEDDSPDAWVKLIERLLASRHYGERWARHWLDVVRYADTAGETADFPVPQAWRYRNYVIDAYNADKPFNQFITEQLAGDILAHRLPADAPPARYAELVTATGYLAIARRFGYDTDKDHYLTIDDTIDTLGKGLLGLTIGCARCHDHKYDPIEVEDYYALYGIFESTRYSAPGCEKDKRQRDLMPLMPEASLRAMVEPYEQRRAAVEQSLNALRGQDEQLAAEAARRMGGERQTLGEGAVDRAGEQKFADGLTAEAAGPITVKRGELLVLSIDPRGDHGADSTRVEMVIHEVGGGQRQWDARADVVDTFLDGNPHADRHGGAHTWSFVDLRGGMRLLAEPIRNYSNHAGLNIWHRGNLPSSWVTATDQPTAAWANLPPRKLFLHPAQDGAVGIVWLCPADMQVRISGLVADAHPEGGNGVAWKLERLTGDHGELVAAMADVRVKLQEAGAQMAEIQAAIPRVDFAYAVAEGQAHDAQIQLRGDPETRGASTPRRFLRVLGGQTLSDASASGRLELTQWIVSPDNPLTARVAVNRIWQHHFGTGLVATTSNFGFRGEPPTHPQLLDYLARAFIDAGWSVKAMHRLIMTSDAYQRSSIIGEAVLPSSTIDPDNLLLWRFDRRRLSAEEIRDAMLAVSDQLDRSPGEGHSFPDPATWQFTQHNPFNAVYEHNRRSIYLMTQRLKRHPYLALFDGADTATSTAERMTTTVPTQALFFMNNPFVHETADRLAERLTRIDGDEARLDHAFELLYGRPVSEPERTAVDRFRSAYEQRLTAGSLADRPRAAWAAWIRVMLSGNEFLYVD